MIRKLSVIFVGLAFLLVVGCAGMRAAASRRASIQNSLTNLSLSASPDQVLSAARMVLVEKGFAPKDIGAGVLETDWKSSSSSSYNTSQASSSSASWKYVVTASTFSNGTKLTVMKNGTSSKQSSSGYSSKPSSERDFEMELEVVRRVDPDTASKIEAEAASAAQTAAAS